MTDDSDEGSVAGFRGLPSGFLDPAENSPDSGRKGIIRAGLMQETDSCGHGAARESSLAGQAHPAGRFAAGCEDCFRDLVDQTHWGEGVGIDEHEAGFPAERFQLRPQVAKGHGRLIEIDRRGVARGDRDHVVCLIGFVAGIADWQGDADSGFDHEARRQQEEEEQQPNHIEERGEIQKVRPDAD